MPARAFVSVPDTAWIGRGTAFSTAKAKRRCTLLAVWYAEQEEPWIILTDLAPDKVEDAQERSISPGRLRAPPKVLAPNHRDPRTRPARTVSVIRHGIDSLRRLLLKGRLWSRAWLLPEP
ncbi:MAG: hypothetical protein OXF79_25955 [Chloroflexi bacterium]|nr:hypothetical protein [Chloroflexota bacterium]